MAASGVVELKESAQLVVRLGSHRRAGRDPQQSTSATAVQRTPVQPAALAVHAYVDVVAPEKAGERFRSGLGPLIGIERLAEAL